MNAKHELSLHTSDHYHRIEWRVHRVGWALIALVLAAALLGAFGSAYFGEARIASPDGAVRVDYLPRARYQTEMHLALDLAPQAGERLDVWLPAAYVGRMNLRRVEPRPERVAVRGERQVFTFAVAAGQPARVVFRFEPDDFGRVRGAAGLADGPSVEFTQLIFP